MHVTEKKRETIKQLQIRHTKDGLYNYLSEILQLIQRCAGADVFRNVPFKIVVGQVPVEPEIYIQYT